MGGDVSWQRKAVIALRTWSLYRSLILIERKKRSAVQGSHKMPPTKLHGEGNSFSTPKIVATGSKRNSNQAFAIGKSVVFTANSRMDNFSLRLLCTVRSLIKLLEIVEPLFPSFFLCFSSFFEGERRGRTCTDVFVIAMRKAYCTWRLNNIFPFDSVSVDVVPWEKNGISRTCAQFIADLFWYLHFPQRD